MSNRPLSDHSQRKAPKNEQIGFYRFERSLGEGNFAKVKLATHTITKEKVLDS
jgi:MAP/microtubule affinity-regulating kinase